MTPRNFIYFEYHHSFVCVSNIVFWSIMCILTLIMVSFITYCIFHHMWTFGFLIYSNLFISSIILFCFCPTSTPHHKLLFVFCWCFVCFLFNFRSLFYLTFIVVNDVRESSGSVPSPQCVRLPCNQSMDNQWFLPWFENSSFKKF